eukprot:SAG11_NODE_5351_length_1587_cov_1.038306_4_plen_46_part_00
MMRVLMDRLFESYSRLNAAKKLQSRVKYFQVPCVIYYGIVSVDMR